MPSIVLGCEFFLRYPQGRDVWLTLASRLRPFHHCIFGPPTTTSQHRERKRSEDPRLDLKHPYSNLKNMGGKTNNKAAYFDKLKGPSIPPPCSITFALPSATESTASYAHSADSEIGLLEEYKSIFIVTVRTTPFLGRMGSSHTRRAHPFHIRAVLHHPPNASLNWQF